MTIPATRTETDVLIIGTGPAGLFHAFYLGLLGVPCHIVDVLHRPGGQVAQLYGDKPIYDIPALPGCTGDALIAGLLEQLRPFDTPMHLGQEVTAFSVQTDGSFHLQTSQGQSFQARSVVIAAGVGAFAPRRLKAPGLESFENTDQLRFAPDPRALDCAGQAVVVAGGDALALDQVLALASLPPAQAPAAITLLHRRAVLQADAERLAQFERLRASGTVKLAVGQVSGIEAEGGLMRALDLTAPDGATSRLPLDTLVVALGLSPRLGPIADWGLELAHKQLPVDTAQFMTRIRGVHAVGDINLYPGKKRLILSAFHEAALAAFAVAERLYPERRTTLQYTSSSSELQQRLGVASAADTAADTTTDTAPDR